MEWSGEGVPPIGTICEAKFPTEDECGLITMEWRKVRILGIHPVNGELYVWTGTNDGFYPPSPSLRFRPIQSTQS